jgi:hypothetical protein
VEEKEDGSGGNDFRPCAKRPVPLDSLMMNLIEPSKKTSLRAIPKRVAGIAKFFALRLLARQLVAP